MAEGDMAQRLVDAVIADFPDHRSGTRPAHTIGIGVTGHFRATKIARDYCIAEHFGGQKVAVTVRFSNSMGSPVQHDGWSDARGMATRFHLEGGQATDLIAMTLREFFSPTPEDFLEFSKNAEMRPAKAASPWSKIRDMLHLKPPLPDPYPGQLESGMGGSLNYANHNRSAQLAAFDASYLGAPVSYARASYNAVHTFVVTAPDDTRRYVRFFWQPVAGVEVTDPTLPPVDDYLQAELRDRLATWPAEFLLLMAVGETGDPLDDPTTAWPLHRARIVMGVLTLVEVPVDQDTYCEKMSFNPGRLTRGIDISNDPILAARIGAYEVSRQLRGGTACPFHKE
ncbi:catalase [Allopontixanthobacter sp.]|uniref:catalase n=1 Tax=Allopontixanthobacter sp. TaxID=2906452 RepID=UPI002AB8A89A|nr:catalase [Allopontixanthobacter sp.]MDZ4308287.1 catalase [Allopontixanthobacter sp.]